MIEWKKEENEKPEYNLPVIIWLRCKKCEKNEPHSHHCLAHPGNFPNSFQRGTYCKGLKNDMFADRYSPEMQEDYWSPRKPSHWAYINPPEFGD